MEVPEDGPVVGADNIHLAGLPDVHGVLAVEQFQVLFAGGDDPVKVDVHDADAPVGVAVLLGEAVDEAPQVLEVFVDEVQQQQVLVAEVVGDGAFGDADLVGDLLEGGVFVPPVVEHPLRHRDDLLPDAGALLPGVGHTLPLPCPMDIKTGDTEQSVLCSVLRGIRR